MKSPPKFWSQTTVVVTGLFLSPFSAVLLQAFNYREVGLADDMKRSGRWLAGLLIAMVVWNLLPFPFSPREWVGANFFFWLVLLAVWFASYGRHFPKRVGAEIIATAEKRHPFFAALIGVSTVVILAIAWELVFATFFALRDTR